MKNPFAISLLLGAAMYAAVGLFGLAIFHGAGPVTQALTNGYGVVHNTIATSETAASDTGK